MSEASLSSRRLPPLSPASHKSATETPKAKPTERKKRTKPAENGHTSPHDEVETIEETSAETPKAKPRRKKKPSSPEPPTEHDVVGDTAQLRPERKKKKKKPKPETAVVSPSEVTDVLAELQDDVLALDESPRATETQDVAITQGRPLKSQTTTKIYVEKPGGTFQRKNAENLAKTRERRELKTLKKQEAVSVTTLNVSLNTHAVFMIAARFLQGLLAGMVLWHIISSYELKKASVDQFLSIYSDLALPAAGVFQFIFIVICVAVLDRHDVASMTKADFTQCFTFRTGGMIIFLYFFGFIMSLAMYHLDDKIDSYSRNATEQWPDPQENEKDVDTWLGLNVARGVFAILGFIVISARPMNDQLYTYLKTFKDPDFHISANDDDDQSDTSYNVQNNNGKIKQFGSA